jgi:copper oxidase (laccase) domain-containing protein
MRAEIMESQQDNRLRAENIAGCFMVDPERDDRYLFDLPGFVRAQLDAAGVAQIADCGENTYTPSGTESPRFFSHRRATHEAAPDSGRQISIISLAATPG